jgi:hypothetical protein
VIQKVIHPLLFDHFQIRHTSCVMRHAVVFELFQNNTGEIGAFTAVGQTLAYGAIPDFAISVLAVQAAAGAEFQLGIFVLVVFRRHVLNMILAAFVKRHFEAAGTTV